MLLLRMAALLLSTGSGERTRQQVRRRGPIEGISSRFHSCAGLPLKGTLTSAGVGACGTHTFFESTSEFPRLIVACGISGGHVR